MFSQVTKAVVGILIIVTLQACVSMSSQRFALKQETFTEKYPQIKKIVVEEAANNGFRELTSEIKPTEYNDWKGQFFFQLKTANGTDQLFVEFKKVGTGISVWVHGAGTRTNPESAAKAIEARLSKL